MPPTPGKRRTARRSGAFARTSLSSLPSGQMGPWPQLSWAPVFCTPTAFQRHLTLDPEGRLSNICVTSASPDDLIEQLAATCEDPLIVARPDSLPQQPQTGTSDSRMYLSGGWAWGWTCTSVAGGGGGGSPQGSAQGHADPAVPAALGPARHPAGR